MSLLAKRQINNTMTDCLLLIRIFSLVKNIAIAAFILIATSTVQAIAADAIATPGSSGLAKSAIKLVHAKTAIVNNAKASIVNEEDRQIGHASFKQVADDLMVHVKMTDLPIGMYTIRLHEIGLCEKESGFLSTGNNLEIRKIKSNLINDQSAKNNQFPYFPGNDDKKQK